MSDDLIGGSSKTNLDFIPSASSSSSSSSSQPSPPSSTSTSTTQSPSAYMRFHGTISTALPSDRPKIQRTGYAAFRTPDQPPTIFGHSVWDVDPYTYIALRVKSDGRSYFVNLQTDGVEPTDLHQHRLFAKRPGQWETVLIKWNDFVRTNYGFVVEPQTELLRQRVRTVGVGLTDRVEGPFELCIERIWATNQEPEPEPEEPATQEAKAKAEAEAGKEEKATRTESAQGNLKNKKGEKIHW